MQYEIKRAIEPYISLVVLSGIMDEQDQQPFFQAIKGLLEEDHSVVLDASGLEDVAAPGLQALVAIGETAKRYNNVAILFGLSAELKQNLEASGTLASLTTAPNNFAAMALAQRLLDQRKDVRKISFGRKVETPPAKDPIAQEKDIEHSPIYKSLQDKARETQAWDSILDQRLGRVEDEPAAPASHSTPPTPSSAPDAFASSPESNEPNTPEAPIPAQPPASPDSGIGDTMAALVKNEPEAPATSPPEAPPLTPPVTPDTPTITPEGAAPLDEPQSHQPEPAINTEPAEPAKPPRQLLGVPSTQAPDQGVSQDERDTLFNPAPGEGNPAAQKPTAGRKGRAAKSASPTAALLTNGLLFAVLLAITLHFFKDAIYLKLFRPDVLVAMEEAKRQRESPDQPLPSEALNPVGPVDPAAPLDPKASINQPKPGPSTPIAEVPKNTTSPQQGGVAANSAPHTAAASRAPDTSDTLNALMESSMDVNLESLLIDMMLLDNNAWDTVIAESPNLDTVEPPADTADSLGTVGIPQPASVEPDSNTELPLDPGVNPAVPDPGLTAGTADTKPITAPTATPAAKPSVPIDTVAPGIVEEPGLAPDSSTPLTPPVAPEAPAPDAAAVKADLKPSTDERPIVFEGIPGIMSVPADEDAPSETTPDTPNRATDEEDTAPATPRPTTEVGLPAPATKLTQPSTPVTPAEQDDNSRRANRRARR